MKRDFTPALAALLFAGICLPSAGWLDLPLLPSTAAGLAQLLGLLAVVLLVMLLGRGEDGGRGHPWSVLGLCFALAPFLLYAYWAQPAFARVAFEPAPALLILALVAVPLAAVGARGVRVVVQVLVLGLGGSLVLGMTGLELWPNALNPAGAPMHAERRVAVQAEPLEGLRRGSPARVDHSPLAQAGTPGLRWHPANVSDLERRPPLAIVFDGAPDARGLATEDRPAGYTLVHASTLRAALGPLARLEPLDLDAFDAAVVLTAGWSDAMPSEARANAKALAGFVRRGGLLLGPAPGRPWPPYLGRRLGPAGQGSVPGEAGVLRLGLGKVARTRTTTGIRSLLASDLWVRTARTAFDRARVAPTAPAALGRFAGSPEAHAAQTDRRAAVGLLFGLVAVLFLFGWILRTSAARAMGALMVALVICLGLAWALPRSPGFLARAVLIEMGGAGGRAVLAVRIEAGSAGYAGWVRFGRPGMFRVLGAQQDAAGRVLVAPNRGAWVVREGLARGRGPGEVDDRFVGFIRPLLTGAIDPKQLRYGRAPELAVRVAGHGPLEALVVRYGGG